MEVGQFARGVCTCLCACGWHKENRGSVAFNKWIDLPTIMGCNGKNCETIALVLIGNEFENCSQLESLDNDMLLKEMLLTFSCQGRENWCIIALRFYKYAFALSLEHSAMWACLVLSGLWV